MFVAFSLPEKICGCAQRHNAKKLASISILQTQNYKSAEKFVNIPSKIYKKVSGNKRKQIQNCTTN